MTHGNFYVATWLYAESRGDESTYYQVPGNPSTDAFQATYWRCVAVLFSTSVRHHPDAKHLLFTNVETLPVVDSVDLGDLLARLGVEVVALPFSYRPPNGYFPAWRNQFYIFDIAGYLSNRLDPGDSAVVLDSDCVWTGDAAPLKHALARDGVLTYVETYPPERAINGLSRIEMSQIAEALRGAAAARPLIYCGGEIFAATGSELRRVNSEVARTWELLLQRHAAGQTTFYEEAQTLSYVYETLGYPLGNANPFIRRIWTGSFGAYNTALPYDHGLLVWHLPLEKRLGLRRLFPEAVDPASRFWTLPTGRPFREYLASYLGVPHNATSKKLRDVGRRLIDRIRYSA